MTLVQKVVGATSCVAALVVALPVGARAGQIQATPVVLLQPPVTRAYNVAVSPGEVLHVEATGTGEAVVIIPGLLGSAFGFRKVIDPIAAEGHRVIVIEPLGVGASGRPKGADYSLEAQARRVGAVLDTLHVTSATIIAHSVGNSIALRLALARPGLVRGVVSIEGGVAEAAGTPGLRHALSMAAFLGHFGLEGMVTGKMRSRFKESSGDPSWITDPVMAGYLAPLKDDYQDVIAGYRAMAAAPERVALAPRLTRLRIPVELLVGTAVHDGGVGEDEMEIMRRLPELTLVQVPGAGHWIQEERPQAIVDAVGRIAP